MEDKLKQIISEELGILSEIAEESEKVFDKIILNLQKVFSTKTDICYIKTNNVEAQLNNIPFNVTYIYRNFFDKTIVETIGEDNLSEGGSAYLNDKFIICNVNLFGINGTINKQLALSTIQHELEHIYQQMRSKKRIPSDDMRYAKMRNDMESSDIIRQRIGRIVYMCYKSEQEGFINGTYAWCMADDYQTKPFTYHTILNSPAGKLLSEFKKLLFELKENKQIQDILKKEYHLTVDRITNAYVQLSRRLGRVLIKVNNDKSKFWRI